VAAAPAACQSPQGTAGWAIRAAARRAPRPERTYRGTYRAAPRGRSRAVLRLSAEVRQEAGAYSGREPTSPGTRSQARSVVRNVCDGS
jgi:hypothetical protein